MADLTKLPAWTALQDHFNFFKDIHLNDLFLDKNRFSEFSIQLDDILLDFSKNRINSDTFRLLLNLAEETGVRSAIDAMFSGEIINTTEKRSVLHTALRDKSKTQTLIDNKNIKSDIGESLNKIRIFSNKVRNGVWKGSTGKKIKDIVNIGIGGSDLGPKMVCESLAYYNDGPSIHFVSNIDA